MTNVSLSIHPRNHYLVNRNLKPGQRVNTSKAAKPVNTSAHEKHVDSNPNDAASRAHLKRRLDNA